MQKNRLVIWITMGVLIILFGLFVWPTIYRYDHIKYTAGEVLIRTNRLTGEVERLYNTGGWRKE